MQNLESEPPFGQPPNTILDPAEVLAANVAQLDGSEVSVGSPVSVAPEILAQIRERNDASRSPVQVASDGFSPDAPAPGIPFPYNPLSLYSVLVSKPQPRRQGGLPEISIQEQDFAEMYGTHYARVVGEVADLLSDSHLAEDAAQQVFAYVWQNWKNFAGEADEARIAWLQLATQKIAAAWNAAAEKEALPFDPTDEDLQTKQQLAADRYIDGGLQHSVEYLALINDHTAMERVLRTLTIRKAWAVISCFFYNTSLVLTVPEDEVKSRAKSRILAVAYDDIVETVASTRGFLTPELIRGARYGRAACADFIGLIDFE